MIDFIDTVYVKNKTKRLRPIRLGTVYDKNQIGEQRG